MVKKFFNLPTLPKNQPGFVLLVGILVVTVIIIFSAGQFDRVANFVRQGSNKVVQQQAVNLAEAGVDYAIWQLNKNAGNWYGTGTEVAVGTTGTFFVTVTDESANIKNVVATGYVPNSTSPRQKSTVKTQVVIGGQTIEFNFATQTGTGGITMNQSSTINGNIYSNGNISAGNGSQQTIDGEAYAVGTIDSPPITVTSGVIEENQEPEDMPTIDYQLWKDEATAGGIIDCAITPSSCNIDGVIASIGPKKYIGNLTISNQAKVTVTGPIYVENGNIIVRNGGTQVNLSQSFGSEGTVIITNGTITVEQGGAFNPNSASPPGYILVVTTSTLDPAMSVSNQGANAVFYALDGGAELSQSAQVNALVAKKLIMRNSATLTYASGLASAKFSSGPGGSWEIRKGSYQYTK
ncbi:MAG: hypothetical protein UU34_C0002G0067 [Candidatus Curtissbacteria bacterium GW2011_GWA1_41_11]|uniref:Uncharacterized protein n=1 Tax=Candidatus Curtissbacteria bacterium GW2011_GWA1_41_11 TaxID=1618409 RepID=A0A0G0WU25_9BACT|nr:MAG: hypothetical protein UU34_C0002G0067 [Candidatus Curtissbacteria bacterium GW2011_GWA1_41_11]